MFFASTWKSIVLDLSFLFDFYYEYMPFAWSNHFTLEDIDTWRFLYESSETSLGALN